jgi:hypothetical protein
MSNRAGKGCGPRPHVWCTGPDKTTHDQYYAWLRQRAQARYRSEPWALRFEDFEHMWAGQWHLRGRGVDNVCMSRVDRDQPWCVENCRIITRLAHAQASSLITHARGQTGPVHKRTFTRV